MSGLFGSSSPPPPPPPPVLEAPDPGEEKRKARLEALRRRRRGRLGTIHTTARGLSNGLAGQRTGGSRGKKLLGE